MNIEFSFYLPQLLLVALAIYLALGVSVYISNLLLIIYSSKLKSGFHIEYLFLFLLQLVCWPLLISWLFWLYQEERTRRLSNPKRRYFLSEESNHVRNGGELDFYDN